MRMCADHWASLRAAIDAAGLGALVAENGEDATRRLAESSRNGTTIDTFEPLLGAHNAILSNALALAGLQIMHPNEDGTERCPLCFLNQMHALHCKDSGCAGPESNPFDEWIDNATEDMVKEWKAFGDTPESGEATNPPAPTT